MDGQPLIGERFRFPILMMGSILPKIQSFSGPPTVVTSFLGVAVAFSEMIEKILKGRILDGKSTDHNRETFGIERYL